MKEEKDKTAKVVINKKVFEVPTIELEDGSIVPHIVIDMIGENVDVRHVPGNFNWGKYHIEV
jgi:hypothetical protein